MQSVEHRHCDHFAPPLHGAHDRRVSIEVLLRTKLVVIRHEIANGKQQRRLPHRDDVIPALSAGAPDFSDQPDRVRLLLLCVHSSLPFHDVDILVHYALSGVSTFSGEGHSPLLYMP